MFPGLIFAVTASALPVDKFAFRAFAPVKSGQKDKFLCKMLDSGMTNFFFNPPAGSAKRLPLLLKLPLKLCAFSIVLLLAIGRAGNKSPLP